uniref:Kinesin-like protein n=1 Tax=Nothobranchius furzeri TaxID=105023 RepID=A0A8C6P826_NOTFU
SPPILKNNINNVVRPSLILGDSDSIKVFVRVRPLTQGTGLTTDGDQNLCLSVTSPHTVRLLSKPEPRTFTYDHVADMETSQESVFNSVAKNIVESCMNGYNGTIFAYGQTGSGKTFTMLGPSEFDNFTDEFRGVIPRSFEYLFFLINREVEKSSKSKSFLCKCSFIEIYNEQIYDLLDTASASLFLRENIKKGVFVEGAVEKFVNSAAEAYKVLSMGWRNRRVASTSMNRESSRSHAVFSMTLESKESVNEVVNIRMSQLNLVDLAGSERQKDTHTEGSRLKEASSINRSLMCLGQVIMALVDVSNGKHRHICYRDSKLTFLLRDSLGGNAKTYIIANVHPGSKCFGETLSTLQFAQRAKLIKNKAVINEDTQGNVKQLQAEVRKLKDQLAQALSFHRVDSDRDAAPGGSEPCMEDEKKMLLKKVAQLEEAWTQKDKFIHSSRMIIRFREEHISRLEKKLKAGQCLLSDVESQALIEQLKKEIKILSDQVDHHPKMTRYAAENYSLREENRMLRSLESVMNAEDVCAQVSAELEEAFQMALESEKLTGTTIEKLNSKLLQKQSDFTAALQAFEEYKEVSKKQLSQLASEKRYLEKSNKHLENILEATHACKNQEVSELNRIHVETLKILSTPTKSYNLRSRLVPLSSPQHLNGNDEADIWSEEPPSDMTEMALTEELHQIQVMERGLSLYYKKPTIDISFFEEQQAAAADCKTRGADLLKSEIHDLRLLLQSSDKELASVKNQLKDDQSEHQQEASQLSNSLISTQLQLDKVQLEWEQLLEQNRTLQDSFDQLQAEAKFDADQAGQQLCDKQQEIEQLKADIQVEEVKYNKREQTSIHLSISAVMKMNVFLEVEVLQEEVAYATEEVDRLTKVLGEQNILLQTSQEQTAKKEAIIRSLQQKVKIDFKMDLKPKNRFKTTITQFSFLQENEMLRQQNLKLSEENGKLVGHKNHKQRIEYLVKLKKENTRLEGVRILLFDLLIWGSMKFKHGSC